MSAIAGMINFNNRPVPNEHSGLIIDSLKEFPADDIQAWHKGNVFLGCLLQWITPESVGELLPFYDTERKLVITADAIIDNREELFELLQINKLLRESITDSQLILHAYCKWGEESPKFLIGDFAYIIWDEKNRKAFGARDFSGTRPLYYCSNQNEFLFCTSIKPLLNLPHIKKRLNEEWLAEYLAISSVVDTADVSITPYENIMQVPPSHSITVDSHRLKINRYCTLKSDSKLKLKSDEEYVEAFQDVFSNAIKSKLRTSYKVGAHLSGGLDSGSVVSYAAREMRSKDKSLHTFSYIPKKGFTDYTAKRLIADESPFIKSTAQYIGGLKTQLLDFPDKDPYTEIDDYLDLLEMPYKFFENSFWIKGIFEKAHQEDIRILLNGGRGNFTISWGHALDYYAVLLKKLRFINLFKELDQYSKNAGGARLRRIPVLARIAFPLLNKYSQMQPITSFPSLINPGWAESTKIFNKLKEVGFDESGWFSTTDIYEMRRRHFEDVFHWNATNNLAAKLSLRHSLWKRDTTNDLRVVRFCLSLPEDQYVQNGLDRALIRRATENMLPDNIRLNQSVRGVQGADWLYRMRHVWREFLNEAKDLINDRNLSMYINIPVLNLALQNIEEEPQPERATDQSYRILMRAVIISRFLKQF